MAENCIADRHYYMARIGEDTEFKAYVEQQRGLALARRSERLAKLASLNLSESECWVLSFKGLDFGAEFNPRPELESLLAKAYVERLPKVRGEEVPAVRAELEKHRRRAEELELEGEPAARSAAQRRAIVADLEGRLAATLTKRTRLGNDLLQQCRDFLQDLPGIR